MTKKTKFLLDELYFLVRNCISDEKFPEVYKYSNDIIKQLRLIDLYPKLRRELLRRIRSKRPAYKDLRQRGYIAGLEGGSMNGTIHLRKGKP